MTKKSRGLSRPTWVAIAAVLLVYVVSLILIERQGFWIVDNENKFLQLQAIANSEPFGTAIPWSGAAIDPGFESNPIPTPFSVTRDGKLYSVFPPLFSILSIPFYNAFGPTGLFVLPLLFTGILLIGLSKMAIELGLDRRSQVGALLLAGLCTPLWFYAIVFWEHAIANCLCVWSVFYALRHLGVRRVSDLLRSAALAAGAIYLRDDLLLFGVALLVTMTLFAPDGKVRTALSFLGAMIAALLPLAVLNSLLMGHPLGFRVESNLVAGFGWSNHLLTRGEVFYNLFLRSSRTVWVSILSMGVFVVAFLLRPRITDTTPRLIGPLFLIAAFTGSAIALASFLGDSSPMRSVMLTNSLFVCSPVLILAFLRGRSPTGDDRPDPRRRFVWFLTLAFGILYGLSAPAVSSWGIHWGNRFLLVLYPLLALLCSANLERWGHRRGGSARWRVGLIGAIVLLSFAAQIGSIELLGRKKEFSARLNRTVEGYAEEVLVTNLTWVPQAIHSVFFTKKIFWVASEAEYQRLLTKLKAAGSTQILFLTRPGTRGQPAPAAKIDDHDLRFFDLWVYRVDLANRD